ncbi:hypothetical protein [Streptomyces guryensis]|uniref:Uncharacterized protein n=1 Tax=Streptomyces guryensis TaxID=2886947 RepID=A0A9Q3VKC1_9ACTN|nr:hypothetical protein [Streptomyces guryensis]MCD9875433.1 hypothetical protein [Streptomyces guryensis]
MAGASPVLVHNSGIPCEHAPRTFSNLIPEDKPGWARTFDPKTIQSGRSGNFAYVVLEDHTLVIGKTTDGHVSLAGGKDVLAAGVARIRSGKIIELNNDSGHYRPYGPYAGQAAEDAFNEAGWDATGKYVEKWPGPACPVCTGP